MLAISPDEIGNPFAKLQAWRERRREERDAIARISTARMRAAAAPAPKLPPPPKTHRHARYIYLEPIRVERPGRRIYAFPIGPVLVEEARRILARDIMGFVSWHTGIPLDDILQSSRAVPLTIARFKAAYLLKRERKPSLPQIGRMLGGRDHTTVLHGIRRAEEMIASGEWTPPTREELEFWIVEQRAKHV